MFDRAKGAQRAFPHTVVSRAEIDFEADERRWFFWLLGRPYPRHYLPHMHRGGLLMAKGSKTAAYYLGEMARFARMLYGSNGIDHAAWAAGKRYVRINGGGVRPISLCLRSPCGALQGFPSSVRPTLNLHKGKEAPIKKREFSNTKPEAQVQAALIEHAKRWPHALPAQLHLADEFEEIRFVNDEMSLPGIRPDVILVGLKGQRWYPIFVELKAGRDASTLIKQLKNIVEEIIGDPETERAFKAFVDAAANLSGEVDTDAAAHDIDVRGAVKLMIWPSATGIPRPLDAVWAAGIRVLEFPAGLQLPEHFHEPSLPFKPVVA